jgi:hypothetical protein
LKESPEHTMPISPVSKVPGYYTYWMLRLQAAAFIRYMAKNKIHENNLFDLVIKLPVKSS